MRHLPLISIMLLLCTVAPLAAQDAAPDTGWPIEQHCVGDPTPPPADWSYDGTILYQGEYGIHGLRSDWPTSRVLAFTNVESPGNYIVQGALSPDKQWYAGAEGDSYCNGSCMSASESVYSIHVFDITGNNPRSIYSMPWKLHYGRNRYGTDRPVMEWFDNEHIIYPFAPSPRYEVYSDTDEWVVNPFTGEMHKWEGYLDLFNSFSRSLYSPDFSRVLEYGWRDGVVGSELRYERLVDGQTGQLIIDLGDETTYFMPTWSPDSSQFLLTQQIDDETFQLMLYDREGNFVENIMRWHTMNVLERGYFSLALKWSPNSRLFAMRWIENVSEDRFPYFTISVIDLEQEQVTNLCLSEFEDFEWSADSDQIIFEDSGLFDLNEWKLYELDLDGFVLGWRAD